MKVKHRLNEFSKSKALIKIDDEEILEQMKKKDPSHIQCFKWQNNGDQCHNSKKRRHQTSTIDVDEEAQRE